MPSPAILVTGATGFIGSHFVQHAHSRGFRVIAVRRSSASTFRIPLSGEVETLDKALEDIGEVEFRGVDALVHLAAEGATARGATWEDCFRVNVSDSVALIQRAVTAGVRRIVVAGTYAEYGRAGLRFDPIPPDAPLEPTDPYATSKAAACVALCGLCRSRKFELSYQRLFSAYGLGQYRENFWPALREAAVAGKDFEMTMGQQIRDFIPVEKVAEKLLHECIREDLRAGEPHIRNLATGRPQTLRAFAEACWADFGAKGQIKFGAVPSRPNEVIRFLPLVSD